MSGAAISRKQKILIFTSKTGGGHISLAEALRDRLQAGAEVEMIDPQPSLIHFHYRLVSRRALWMWALEYRLSDSAGRSQHAHRAYNILLARRIDRVLLSSQPDLVITTFPFLTSEVTQAMRRIGRRVPFVMLLADPNGVHHSWLSERSAEAVLAPTQEDYDQALRSGMATERLHLSGWPVRAQFYTNSTLPRREMLSSLGLHPARFTIFLQGGGEGAARFIQTVEAVLSVEDCQVILAAGTNQGLYQQFQGLPRVHALAFTKEIAPYMAVADVVMGKAGPNMLFESVTLGKPFIASAYIPGQEKANLQFILRHQLGWVTLDAVAQTTLIRSLTAGEGALDEIRAGVAAYRAWNNQAVDTISPLLMRLAGTG